MKGAVGTRNLIHLAVLLAITLIAGRVEAIDISGTGSWSPTTDSSNLTAGAGSNLTDSYESESGVMMLAISNTSSSSDNWRVDARRSDTNWNSNLVLSVQRTGAGTGNGIISGGYPYQAVTTSDAAFFTGTGDRTNIRLQLKISQVSLSIPPNTYSTSVIFTVVDT